MIPAAAIPPVPVTAAAPPAPLGQLDDFSDRLSPMLVKELRQGLRARTFVIVFLTLQALLALILLSASAATGPGGAGLVISRIIFLFFSLAVLVIQPLRAIGALSSEIKGSTIDLMVLTRLSAWRIVTGKWVSIVGQSALLLAAIVPYLILRYFFGSMQLFAELLALVSVFLASAMLTAVMVGLSACGSLLVRGILPVFGTPLLVIGIFGTCMSNEIKTVLDFFVLTDRWAWIVFATCLALGGYLSWAALDFGATQVAPLAENRAVLRRAVAFTACLALAALSFFTDSGWLVIALLVVLTPLTAVSLTEPADLVPVVTRPFVRLGWLGRMAGRFLYPVWPAGLLFCIPACILAFAVAVFHADLGSEELGMLTTWAGSLLFPAVWVVFFRKKIQNPFGTYVLILAASFILLMVVGLLSETMDDEVVGWMFCWLPPAHLVFLEGGRVSNQTALFISSCVGSIYLFILLGAAFARFPVIRAAEIEGSDHNPTTQPAPTEPTPVPPA